ncbi:MAG: DNA repair protein RadC [Verrucomicrobiota bacterium]
MTHTISEMQQCERPRERLWERGPGALRVAELLAILLRTGVRGKSAIDLGEELLARYGSIDGLSRVSVQELAGLKGLGMAKAIQLKAAFELGVRLSNSKTKDTPLDTPESVITLVGEEMRMLDHECLRVLAVNTRLRLIGLEVLSRGTVNETIAHPRDVMRIALTYKAFGLIVVHNHPSGDPSPSSADLAFTRNLAKASDLLQVELVDHLIIGGRGQNVENYYSFKEAGYL